MIIVSVLLKANNLSAYNILAYLSDLSWIVTSSLYSSSNAQCQIFPIFIFLFYIFQLSYGNPGLIF